MNRLLTILILIPTVLMAQALKVEKPKKFEQPPGTIDRVSKRTANSRTLEIGYIGSRVFRTSISSEPMHYRDSTGTWQRIAFDERDTGAKGKGKLNKEIDAGRFKVKYSTEAVGHLRYEGEEGYIEFTPAFDSTQVKSRFELFNWGVKATYILDDKSPTRLAWGLNATASRNKILPPKAWDSNGKTVAVTEQRLPDSLIYYIDNTVLLDGSADSIIVDPSVVDSIAKSASALLSQQAGGTYQSYRDSTNAKAAYSEPISTSPAYFMTSSPGGVNRLALSFPMTALDIPATVDSVRMYLYNDGSYPASDSVIAYALFGTFTGTYTEPASLVWFSQFQGRTVAAPHTSTPVTTGTFVQTAAAGAQYVSRLFTAAALDSVYAVMGFDTLRIMVIMASDYDNSGTSMVWQTTGGNPTVYLDIYYQEINPAGVSTEADTSRYLKLDATVDSLGGRNLTLRGFQYCPVGDWSDTTIVSETGDFGVGVYSLLTGILAANASVAYRAFAAHVTNDTSFSVWDTAAPGGGTSTSLKVDGRTVNSIR